MSKALDKIMDYNGGYEDGKAHRARGKSGPAWARCWQYEPPHPFNKQYGLGYWDGFSRRPPTNKHAVPYAA